MPVDVVDKLEDLIKDILGNRDAAQQYAQDPYGTLVAQGITEGDLEGLNMQQIVADSCQGLDLPDGARSAVQSYTGGGGGPSGYAPPPAGPATGVEQVMQHLNYVTYVAYEGDETIIGEITNIDQSQNVNVEGEVHGSVNVDSHDVNANATGDGSAASGFGPATAGDENVVNTGLNLGNMNTGDDAVQVQAVGSDVGPINTGEFTGIQADGPINAPGAVMSFGEGDAVNQIGNVVGPGGALSGTGDATGHYEDNDITEQTQIQAVGSNVAVEQGPGDQHAQQDEGFDLEDLRAEPVRLLEREGGDEGGDEAPETLEAL
ncbi:MAG: hypothetical protein L0Y54_01610 [Sporichthyaceae bacterium]|nr:hypothetical protein [Sporichthyaceae bacterium]